MIKIKDLNESNSLELFNCIMENHVSITDVMKPQKETTTGDGSGGSGSGRISRLMQGGGFGRST
jgi:hypothetical protein